MGACDSQGKTTLGGGEKLSWWGPAVSLSSDSTESSTAVRTRTVPREGDAIGQLIANGPCEMHRHHRHSLNTTNLSSPEWTIRNGDFHIYREVAQVGYTSSSQSE